MDSHGFVRRHLPNALVLLVLAGLAYAGHRTGWKVPKLADLRGASKAPKEDWCEAHNVPDSRCLACHPELGGNDAKDWCKEHGVPESKCTVCHPEILAKGAATDWCKEHGVPESGCTLCHPEIAVKGAATVTSQTRVVLEPGAKTDPAACQTHLVRIQFASAEAVKKCGVRLGAVEERPMTAAVTANAKLGYDTKYVARLSARVPGTVWRFEKEVGARVAKGEVIALVDAAEVGRAKSELLQALAAQDHKSKVLARVQSSASQGLRSQAELQEAEAAAREARVRVFTAQQALANLGLAVRLDALTQLPEEKLADSVRFLGLSDSVVKSLDHEAATANLLPTTSPIDGEVVAREVVAGEVIDTNRTLLVVADVTRLWVNADVPSEDARNLAVGQRAWFRPDSGLDDAAPGKVIWISPAVDEKTRTVRVRAEIENPERRLRAGTFGTATIAVRDAPNAVAVPDEAIHWEGCCHVVFVKLTDDIFQTRKVRLGARSGGFTEVTVGVSPGEVVVTTGSHVLKSELLKSKLGAGCCD